MSRLPLCWSRSSLTVAAFAALLALVTVPGCKHDADDSGSKPAATETPATGESAPTNTDPGAVLATVGDVTITVDDFESQINGQTPYVRARYTSLEKKREFLDNMIRFEVMAKEAARRGFDKDPEVLRAMKQVMIQKLVKDQFKDDVDPSEITEAEMRAYYDEHESDYNRPEQVRVAAVVLDDLAAAKKVFQLAEGVGGKNHAEFRKLVMEHTTDEAGKNSGGDLGYFSADTTEVPKPVVDAAFGLDNGAVAGPIKTDDGKFYVIKITGKRTPIAKSFDDVKRQIQNRLYRDRRTEVQREFVESLRSQAKVEINEANLEKVEVNAPKGELRRVEGFNPLSNIRKPPTP
ncbi:MAG: peptidylprolyl isomerase [Haliangiales bacterium]